MTPRSLFTTAFAAPLVALAACACATGASAAERAHWGYAGAHGPAQWAQLDPDYASCEIGHEQSPIDIRETRRADLPAIRFEYRPMPLAIVDNGHTVQVEAAPGSSISVGDDRYALAQLHFHHPSEERVGGQGYPMVAHLVHRNAEGRLAVVGVLLQRGQRNPLLDVLWSRLPAHAREGVKAADVTIDAAQLLPAERGYYTFAGSLTTPPCSEGVRWFVLKQPLEVSTDQIEAFAHRYPNNARPVQPLNARVVRETLTPQ